MLNPISLFPTTPAINSTTNPDNAGRVIAGTAKFLRGLNQLSTSSNNKPLEEGMLVSTIDYSRYKYETNSTDKFIVLPNLEDSFELGNNKQSKILIAPTTSQPHVAEVDVFENHKLKKLIGILPDGRLDHQVFVYQSTDGKAPFRKGASAEEKNEVLNTANALLGKIGSP